MGTPSLEVREARSKRAGGLHSHQAAGTNSVTAPNIPRVTPERIRLEAVLTVPQLALRAGVSRQTICRIEAGQIRHLRPLILEKIAVALCERFADRGMNFTLAEYIDACLAVRK